MTNFRDEDGQLASDLGELYAASVPHLRFDPAGTVERVPAQKRLAWLWRPGLAAAAAAAAVAAVLAGPSLWNGESETVSAETILARASDAAQSNAPASGSQSYHLIATTESGASAATTTETWYVDSAHQRTENEYTGDDVADFGISVSGDDAWMYGDFGNGFRAVHGPASELGMTFPTESGAASLADIIGGYSGSCQKAAQDGEETIAGRAAYRIVVTADIESCPAPQDGRDKYDKFGTLVLAVDKETFLPLKTEQLDDGLIPAYTYLVTSFQVGEDVPDTTFAYDAPEGVTVVDVANLTEAKNVISGLNVDGTAPTP